MSHPSLLHLVWRTRSPTLTSRDAGIKPDMRLQGAVLQWGPHQKHELNMSLVTFVYHMVGNHHNCDELRLSKNFNEISYKLQTGSGQGCPWFIVTVSHP